MQEKTLKRLQIIHLSLVIGLILMGCIFQYILNTSVENFDPSPNALFRKIAAVIAFIGITLGHFIYKHRLSKISTLNSLSGKMVDYIGANIIKLAMVEGPALISLIFFFLTGDSFLFSIYLVCLVVMVFYAPLSSKVSNELNLTNEESEKLKKDSLY